MESLERLRKWAKKYANWFVPKETLSELIDAIEEEHEETARALYKSGVEYGLEQGFADVDLLLDHQQDKLAEHGYIKLPVDADGEFIHFGDVLDQFGTPMTVFAMSDPDPDQGDCMLELITDGISDGTWVRARKMRHHKPPTVEDVLREFAEKMNENMGMYTGEAIDADEWRSADNATIAEYATKLRLAGDGE